MAHPNQDLVRRGYAAFGCGDTAALRQVIAADVVWRFAGRGPVSGEHRGIDAVLGAFAEIAQRSGGTFRVELHDVLANDEHAVALVERTARHNGRELRSRGADVFHIRGGQVVEYWDCPTDAHAEEEFWA